MSGLNIQNSRLQQKYSTVTGATPTIAPSTDHTDGTWTENDIYIGELYINVQDDTVFYRSLNGIIPIQSGTTTINTTTFVNKTGDTMSGGLITPSLSAISITATTIYSPSFNGTFIGDGSGLTGITSTVFTGGTISGPVIFTSDVNLCGAAVTVSELSGCGGSIDVYSPINALDSISATTFYGDGSNLTNLPYFSGITLDEVLNQGDTSTDNNIRLTNGDIILDNGVFFGDGSGLTNIPSSPVPTLDAVLTAGNVSDDYDILLTNGNIVLGNGIFYGDGSGLTNIGAASDIYVTGGTYDNSTGTATFSNTSGGTFQVSGFTTGSTSSFTGYTYIQEDVSLQSLALSGSSTIIFDIEDFNYKNYTQRDSYLLNSQIEDKLNGDTANIVQGFPGGGGTVGLNVKNSGNTINSLVNVGLGIIELKTESDLEDRLILQTQSDTNIVRSITIPSDANTYYLETSNIFQQETIITNSEYTIIETTDAIIPKQETRISQPNIDDTQSIRLQEVGVIRDEITDGVDVSYSETTIESIYHTVQGSEGQEDFIQINNGGVTLGEVEGSSFTNYIVNNENGFYQSQFQSTGISKGVSKTNFRSVQTTDDTIISVVYPLSDLEIETGAIGVKATVTALNIDEDTAYVAELYAAVRINSYAPTIFGGVDKLEKTEFTTATATIEIESSNLAIRVTGESATTIKWSVKYELIYAV
jgi:hypothetical protein